ncbi:hypothetical protein GW17_00013402 [Ensete ventricosum]|nr:hypothetical protein GW17_00013402 [Ensete ventricosum]
MCWSHHVSPPRSHQPRSTSPRRSSPPSTYDSIRTGFGSEQATQAELRRIQPGSGSRGRQ